MANLGFGVLCSKLQWQWTRVSPISGLSDLSPKQAYYDVLSLSILQNALQMCAWFLLNAIFRVFCVRFNDVQNNCNLTEISNNWNSNWKIITETETKTEKV